MPASDALQARIDELKLAINPHRSRARNKPAAVDAAKGQCTVKAVVPEWERFRAATMDRYVSELNKYRLGMFAMYISATQCEARSFRSSHNRTMVYMLPLSCGIMA
jgi:hypothetical protein